MAKGKLYEYAVLLHPRVTARQVIAGLQDEAEVESPKSELIVPIASAVAENEDHVKVIAIQAATKTNASLDPAQLEILIRPFVP